MLSTSSIKQSLFKENMVCLGVKYPHGTIGSYSHSSVENACVSCVCVLK